MTRPAHRLYSLLFGLVLIVTQQVNVAAKEPEDDLAWAKVMDTDLQIGLGSVLDFSKLFGSDIKIASSPVGIDNQGHLALNKGMGERVRFLCATLIFGGPHGGFPDHSTLDELALQLRMHGYNLVRFHFIDDALMEGRKKDFDYDPQALDRFHYLLASLKKQGIYWMLDAATSEKGVYARTGSTAAKKRNVRLALHVEPAAQEHWKKIVTTILGTKNPYTKQSVLHDPALVTITIMNESGLEFLTRQGYQDELRQPFIKWLREKYKSTAALKAAWKDNSINSMDAVNFPTKREASPRVDDLLRFFSDLEHSTLQWTTDFLRKQGYEGLVTNYNNGRSVYSRVIGRELDLVTQHAYYDHPSDFIRPGSKQKGTSSIEDIVPYAREFSSSRYGGRPFIVDEYDHPFWSPWRREAGIVIPAYAALQGWDGIARFASPVKLGYGKSKHQRHTVINPFGIGMDPVARAGETLAALLFRRADVKPAQSSVAIDLSPQAIFDGARNRWRLMPDNLSAIGLVTGLSLRWTTDDSKEIVRWTPDLALPLVAATSGRMHKVIDKVAGRMGKLKPPLWSDRVVTLRKSGILSGKNRTDPASGIYQSDTGEILLESRERRMRVITPNTEAVVFEENAPLTLSQLKIESSSSPALISVSSVDGRGLADSERMLIIFATDALNSDMRFSDGRKVLEKLGGPPVLIHTARATVVLKHNSSENLRLYSTTLNGTRMDPIPTEKVPDGLRFTLDTGKLTHGPTTYFELVSEGSEPPPQTTIKH